MRIALITGLICLIAYNGIAQEKDIDSMKRTLSTTTDLIEKYKLLDRINSGYYKVGTGENPVDNSFEMVRIALQLENDSLIAKSYNALGDYFIFIKGDNTTGLEYLFKGIPYAEKIKNGRSLPSLYVDVCVAYWSLQNYKEQLQFLKKAEASLPDISHPEYDYLLLQLQTNYSSHYLSIKEPEKALPYIQHAEKINSKLKYPVWDFFIAIQYGVYYGQTGDYESGRNQFEKGLELDKNIQVPWVRYIFKYNYINFLVETSDYAAAKTQTNELMAISRQTGNDYFRLMAIGYLKTIFDKENKLDSAYHYARQEATLKDSVFNQHVLNKIQALNFNEEIRKKEEEEQRWRKIKTTMVLAGFAVVSVIALILYRNSRQRKKANIVLEKTLFDLRATQSQLVQSEKMASLGELTAGIAHEIQNPLNFVNNFSDVNSELIDEAKQEIDKGNINEAKVILGNIKENEEKINHHGKRADTIVKGMLQHSRSSSGQKESTDINALADEYLRLAFHGLRARDKSFNATLRTDYDKTIGNINIISQDIGRAILNLITNAFYVVDEKKKSGIEDFESIVTVSTRKANGKVELKVADNGNGIPKKILDKIFQPFFTTKPTGQGTGLGLSLSYDIIKSHGGELRVETKEGEGTIFIIQLPV